MGVLNISLLPILQDKGVIIHKTSTNLVMKTHYWSYKLVGDRILLQQIHPGIDYYAY